GMANYCRPEVVYATGKKGEFFNPELCGGSNLSLLGQKHREGVNVFCQQDNGYSFGASGKKYNQICPKELESAFLTEYRRGRKVYLDELILQKQQQLNQKERELRLTRSEESIYTNRLMRHNASRPSET